MSFEFKIGDKIKVTGAACTNDLYTKIIGYIGTIMEYPFHHNPNGKYVVKIDGVRNSSSTKGYFYIDTANMKHFTNTPNCSKDKSLTNHKEENNMNTNKPKNKNSRNHQKSIHNNSVFRVSTETGERYISNGKHNGKTIPTITTIVSINGKVGKATCDKDNYNEREGIINALANMATGGNFDREYNKWTKYINAINTQKCTCKYCGTVYNTSAEARDCESAHIAKKKAKHEAYMIRREARNRIAKAEFENKVEEVMKSIYEKAKENIEAPEAEDITNAEVTLISDNVTETTTEIAENTATKSDNSALANATE